MKGLEHVLILVVKMVMYIPYGIYKHGISRFWLVFDPIGYVVPPMPKKRPKPKPRPKPDTRREKYRLVPSNKEGLYDLESWDAEIGDYWHEKGNIRPEEADQIIKNLEREVIYYREGA